MPIYKVTVVNDACFFKEEITAENLAMMSRVPQIGKVANVQRSNRINDYDRRHSGGGTIFSEMLEHEEKRLNTEEFNGLDDNSTVDATSSRLAGKVSVYDHQGMISYFRMAVSMTDLKG